MRPTSSTSVLLLWLSLMFTAVVGCTSSSPTSPPTTAVGDQPTITATVDDGGDQAGAVQEDDIPESMASIVDSLPDSEVRVFDPAAASNAARIADLAESTGATVDGDVARIVIEESVLFEFGSADLLESAGSLLDDIAELLTELSSDRIEVVGHTDSIGTDEFNRDLSTRRAEAVRLALIERGLVEDDIETRGEGESQPVAPNTNEDGSDNPEGRAQNRRVEIMAQSSGE